MKGGEGVAEDFRGATNSATNTESERFSGVLLLTDSSRSGDRAARSQSSARAPPPGRWLGVSFRPSSFCSIRPIINPRLNSSAHLTQKRPKIKLDLTGRFCLGRSTTTGGGGAEACCASLVLTSLING